MPVFRLVCSDYDLYIARYVSHPSATAEVFLARCQELKPRALRIALTLKRSKIANDPDYAQTTIGEDDLQEGFLRAFEELGYTRYEMPSFAIDHRTWTNPPDAENRSCAFGEEASIRAFWGEELYAELAAYNAEVAQRATASTGTGLTADLKHLKTEFDKMDLNLGKGATAEEDENGVVTIRDEAGHPTVQMPRPDFDALLQREKDAASAKGYTRQEDDSDYRAE